MPATPDDALQRSREYAALRQQLTLEGVPSEEIDRQIADMEERRWWTSQGMSPQDITYKMAGVDVGQPTQMRAATAPAPTPTPTPTPTLTPEQTRQWRGHVPVESPAVARTPDPTLMKSSPAYREHFEKTLPEHEAQAPWTRTAEGLQYHVPQTDPGGGRGGTFIPTDVEAEHLRRQFPDQPDVFLEDLSGLTSPVPSIEDVLAEPTAMTPEPPPPADRSQMPTTGGDSGVEAAPTQMYSYVDEDGNRVFTNIAAPGRDVESYDTGVEDFKQRAMTRAQTRAAEPQLPQGLDVPPVGMGRDPGRVRPAPTMGRTRGDFDDLVRPGRGGFSPSAEVPEAGTISQAEYQQLTPGQQRAYDREFAGWVTRLQAEMQVDPLAAYNRASEQIMKQPVYAAKLTALKADLDKMVEAQQISPEQYEMALAGAQQQIVQEAMMAMGVAGASLDPRTHQRTGVLGY